MHLNTSRGVFRKLLRRLSSSSGLRRRTLAADQQRSAADLQRGQAEFEEWRRRNPAMPLKEFSVERMEATLAEGGSHPSLGANLRDGANRAAENFFNLLVQYGLKENDACVDYGCGTLRVGQHVIGFIGRGRYWGLDISQRLLAEGRALIGSKLSNEKEPRLHVISATAVSEAAAAKPAMLFSHKVLPHVYPAELPEYFRNIMTIIGRSGQAIIDGKWSEDGIVQYRQRAWAHSARDIRALIASMEGEIVILKEKDRDLAVEDSSRVRTVRFRLVHKDGAGAFKRRSWR